MIEAVLAHELAHLRRYDLWVNLLQRTVETVLFFHPGGLVGLTADSAGTGSLLRCLGRRGDGAGSRLCQDVGSCGALWVGVVQPGPGCWYGRGSNGEYSIACDACSAGNLPGGRWDGGRWGWREPVSLPAAGQAWRISTSTAQGEDKDELVSAVIAQADGEDRPRPPRPEGREGDRPAPPREGDRPRPPREGDRPPEGRGPRPEGDHGPEGRPGPRPDGDRGPEGRPGPRDGEGRGPRRKANAVRKDAPVPVDLVVNVALVRVASVPVPVDRRKSCGT